MLERRRNPRPWIERNLQIRTKDRRVVPFAFNSAQVDYYDHRTRRDIILKPRQLGFTTLICGLFFADTLLRPNTTSVIVAHDTDSSEKIFRIVQLFWERLPEAERRRVGEPRFSNRREFLWPSINSHFFVGTAGALTFGRGQTINNLHCSEFAFWPKPEEALTALTEAVPADGRIVIESTANGMGNYFHDLWVEAKAGGNAFAPQFYVWFESPEYRMAGEHLGDLSEEESQLKMMWGLDDDQIRWRRGKQRELRDRFAQEYPESDVTCFLASGRCCFDVNALTTAQARIAAEAGPEIAATLPDGDASISVAPARLLVWKRPEKGRLYVIGADVGEGIAGGDASCACVLDKETGEQVAELHGRIPPERFGQLLHVLGWFYNMATVAVERNNHGHSTLNTLRHALRYPRLYYHVRYDRTGNSAPMLGWPTDQATKPILVDDLAAAIAGGHLLVHSSGLIDECFTFVTTDSGSQEAQEGKHDDRVIAAGIAWQARKRGASRGTSERPAGW
ncbi:MAG: hypothetical protein ACE149_18965 [Armatimonadota bacterium]